MLDHPLIYTFYQIELFYFQSLNNQYIFVLLCFQLHILYSHFIFHFINNFVVTIFLDKVTTFIYQIIKWIDLTYFPPNILASK